MKFLNENKKYISISTLVLFVIFSTIIFIEILNNGEAFVQNIKNILTNIAGILSPFLIGFFIAFMLNTPSKFFFKVFNKLNIFSKKRTFMASLIFTYTLFIGTFVVIFRLILPAIALSSYQLGSDVYEFISLVQQDLQKAIYDNNNFLLNDIITFINENTSYNLDINNIISSISGPILSWAQNLPNIIVQVISSLVSLISIIFNIVLAIIISIYFLIDKQRFIDFGTKVSKSFFKEKTSNRILYVSSITNSIFQKFLIGKALDSLIIGFLFYIITKLLVIPYALLFSVIIGITNMIPYFGPFIGAIPVVGLLLIIDFKMALITSVIILALQQFDGIFLGPKILGDSTGVRPIGIVFAVSIGGHLFGSLGMLLGVPIFATLSYFFNEYMDKKYNKKLTSNKKEYYNTKKEENWCN